MSKHEYKIEKINIAGSEEAEKLLNRYGNEGWKIVASSLLARIDNYTQNIYYVYFVFEREIKEKL